MRRSGSEECNACAFAGASNVGGNQAGLPATGPYPLSGNGMAAGILAALAGLVGLRMRRDVGAATRPDAEAPSP